MAELWDEERARVELANQAEFRSILEGKRRFMEDALAEKADPAAAVQVVHDLETLRLQLDRPTIQIEITQMNT